MNKTLVTALFLLATSAFAANTAKLDFGSFAAGYDVELTDNMVTGNQTNLGWGSGKVELAKKDGNWQGRFGFNQISVNGTRKRSETKTQLAFNVLPGGTYTANLEKKADKRGVITTSVNLLLPRANTAYATLKTGKYLEGSNRTVSLELQRKEAGKYEGRVSVYNGRSFETSEASLVTTAQLDPEMLMETDPALFVILYVLPYSYN